MYICTVSSCVVFQIDNFLATPYLLQRVNELLVDQRLASAALWILGRALAGNTSQILEVLSSGPLPRMVGTFRCDRPISLFSFYEVHSSAVH